MVIMTMCIVPVSVMAVARVAVVTAGAMRVSISSMGSTHHSTLIR